MRVQEKVFLSCIFLAILVKLYAGSIYRSNLDWRISLDQLKQNQDCPIIKSIQLIRTDNKGNDDEQGGDYVIILDPKSQELDFKVSLGLAHKLYAKDDSGKFRQQYIPKLFHELISDENSTLDGKRPIAAINADYIDIHNKPQGLNISRGVEYSGIFKYKRSSFGISEGKPEARIATIQLGKRKNTTLNYNVVGGNGRFYRNGKFKDVCDDLGDYCEQKLSRSLVAITAKGYVIFLVNNTNLNKALYPSMFNRVLAGIAANYCLGKIEEGMLFDGGFSTGLYFDNKIYVENPHPVGSVFLIYKK